MTGEIKPVLPASPPKRSSPLNAVVGLVVLLVAAVLIGKEYKSGVFDTRPRVEAWTPPPPPTPRPLAEVTEALKRAEADKTLTGQSRVRFVGFLQGELARSKAIASGQPDPAMVDYERKLGKH